jgi:TorA maturation chaperone TorD
MNEFSILCRVLGTLYYRQPQDPLLVPLFTMIREGKLAQNWPLEQDELLERLQKAATCSRFRRITTRCSWVKSAAFRRTVQPGRKGRRKRKCALSL